jgi:hypothetical protein
MADAGIFIGWSEVVRGRESQAVESFNEALQFFAERVEDGTLESFEPVFLEPHGGDLGGFILLRGDVDKLAALRTDDEFTHLITRAQLCVDGMGVVGADLAARLERAMAYYTEQIAAFA